MHSLRQQRSVPTLPVVHRRRTGNRTCAMARICRKSSFHAAWACQSGYGQGSCSGFRSTGRSATQSRADAAIAQRDSIIIGLAAILLWYQTDIVHVIGHIISARLSKAPMDYVKWGIMPLTGYHDHDVTPEQHIGRSVGGPIASALAVVGYQILWLLREAKARQGHRHDRLYPKAGSSRSAASRRFSRSTAA